jgi:hypothetical protein
MPESDITSSLSSGRPQRMGCFVTRPRVYSRGFDFGLEIRVLGS